MFKMSALARRHVAFHNLMAGADARRFTSSAALLEMSEQSLSREILSASHLIG